MTAPTPQRKQATYKVTLDGPGFPLPTVKVTADRMDRDEQYVEMWCDGELALVLPAKRLQMIERVDTN